MTDRTGKSDIMPKLAEYDVPCTWCGAKVNEPCIDLEDKPYVDLIHRPRRFEYEQRKLK